MFDDDLLEKLNSEHCGDDWQEVEGPSPLTPEDILASPVNGDLVRILLLSNTKLACVMISELDDSFLVALPVRITKKEAETSSEEERFSVAPYSHGRSARIMKTAIAALLHLDEAEEKVYRIYLEKMGEKKFPGLAKTVADANPKPQQKGPTQLEMFPSEHQREELLQLAETLEYLLQTGLLHRGNKTTH